MIGKVLGPYRIVGPLGSGGMATVFRARDDRLHRDVALKLISIAAGDPTAVARFEREARAAAHLNHAHICTIFDVGEAEGQPYIAMELVEGAPLRTLAAAGLPLETVLRLGIQIADAIAHAHERGVIHRDLKTSNVVISREGRAKVLDFGLARRHATGAASAADHDPTLTETGAIVGTPQYLAPEVLRGGEADARSDLWALGVVLYEMACGALPFQGGSSIEIGAAILGEAPRPLPDRVPAGLRAVIQRCLAKDRAQRFGGAAEVRAALEALESDSAGRVIAPAAPPRRAWPVLAAVAALLGLGMAGWLATRGTERPRELRQQQLTSNTESNPVSNAALSPDGKYVVFVDPAGAHLRLVETGETRDVLLPQGLKLHSLAGLAGWFPDGTRLLVSGKQPDGTASAWSVPAFGGPARRLIVGGRSAVASPDGQHIAFVRDAAAGPELWISDAEGGGARRLVASDSTGVLSFIAPAWAPGSHRVAYGRQAVGARGERSKRLESCDLRGGIAILLADSLASRLHPLPMMAWLPDGRILFPIAEPAPNTGDMNLWARRVNPETGSPAGTARQVTHLMRTSYPLLGSASADGKRLTVTLIQYPTDIYVGEIDAPAAPLRGVRRLTLDNLDDDTPAWTPDSRAVLYSSNQNGTFDVFRQGLDEASAEAIVPGPGDQYGARVTADGRWILYLDAPTVMTSIPNASLMRTPTGGGGRDTLFRVTPLLGFRLASRDPSRGVLMESSREGFAFTSFDVAGTRGPIGARVKSAGWIAWDLSPDGTQVAYCGDDSLAVIRVVTMGGGAPREIRLDQPLQLAGIAWAATGGGWFVFGPADDGWLILRVDERGRCTRLVPPLPWMRGFSPSPDGRHLAFSRNTVQSNAWLLEGF